MFITVYSGIAPVSMRDGGAPGHISNQFRGRTAAGTRGAGGSNKGYSARSLGGVASAGAGGYRGPAHTEVTGFMYTLTLGLDTSLIRVSCYDD